MKNKGDWMILLAALAGGAGIVSVKYLLDWGFDPFQVMLGRFLFACVCLGLVYHKELKKITKKEWKAGGMLGLLLSAMFVLVTVGLQYTTPSVSGFPPNMQAVIVPFICWVAFKQRPTKNCMVAAFFTLIGVAMLSITSDFRLDLGAGLSLAAAFAFSFQMAFIGKILEDCDSIHIALVENAVVAVVSLVLVCVRGRAMPPITPSAVINFFALGVFCTGLYFVLQSVGQKHTTANKTAIIITSESIFAALFSLFIYGERMSMRGYFGCVIIFAAMILAELPFQKKSKETEIEVDSELEMK